MRRSTTPGYSLRGVRKEKGKVPPQGTKTTRCILRPLNERVQCLRRRLRTRIILTQNVCVLITDLEKSYVKN